MKTIHVAIICMPNTLASTDVGPFDILTQAGLLWNHLHGLSAHPIFNVSLISLDGKAVTCSNGLTLPVSGDLSLLSHADLAIISAADVGSLSTLPENLSDLLTDFYRRGGYLSSVCTGAFALASTGLLNGRKATTHWGMAPTFKKCYPDVILQEEQMVTEDGHFFCSGGISAYQDLSLRLIEFFGGYQLAEETARAMILSGQRQSQSPFRRLETMKQHQDKTILKLQGIIEENHDQKLLIPELAKQFHMSQRHLERRFKQATGESIGNYIQIVRIEIARDLLRKNQLSISVISEMVGYQDMAHFRRIFSRWTNFTPTAYRQKYSRPEVSQALAV